MLLTKERRFIHVPISVITLIGLGLTLPALFVGMFGGHDFRENLLYIRNFSDQFWAGDRYPRWLSQMNAGLGSPTFFFYAPLPYFMASLFHFAGSTWNQMILSAGLGLVGSGIAAYLWLSQITRQRAALVGSILYMLLPYHLAIDLYQRFALAEYWAFVWMPLVLFFCKRLAQGSKTAVVGIAVANALLAMTHLPTFVMFFPVPLVYLFVLPGKQTYNRILQFLALATVLTAGLAAIYCLPALTTQGSISMEAILERAYRYSNNFLFTGPLFQHSVDFWRYLEFVTLGMTISAIWGFWMLRSLFPKATVEFRRETSFWFGTAIVTALLTTPLSQPLWDLLPVLQRVQYPWRLNTVLTIAVTALLALVLSQEQWLERWWQSRRAPVLLAALTVGSALIAMVQLRILLRVPRFGVWTGILAIVATITVILIVTILWKKGLKPEVSPRAIVLALLLISLILNSGLLTASTKRPARPQFINTLLDVQMSANEHRPRWVPLTVFQPETLKQLGKESPPVRFETGQGSYEIQTWKARQLNLQVTSPQEGWITLSQFYYPGWVAKAGGTTRPVRPEPSTGLVQVSLPAGTHSLAVTLEAGIEERLGIGISLVSLMVAIVLVFWWPLGKRLIQLPN